MFTLLHKHKKSDIRRHSKLQSRVAMVWDDPHFQMVECFLVLVLMVMKSPVYRLVNAT